MRHKKFDHEWSAACDLLPEQAATELREAILRLQYHEEDTTHFTYPEAMALFTVIRPTIEKRAQLAAKARARREAMRHTTDNNPAESAPADPVEIIETQSEPEAPHAEAPETPSAGQPDRKKHGKKRRRKNYYSYRMHNHPKRQQ